MSHSDFFRLSQFDHLLSQIKSQTTLSSSLMSSAGAESSSTQHTAEDVLIEKWLTYLDATISPELRTDAARMQTMAEAFVHEGVLKAVASPKFRFLLRLCHLLSI